MGGGDFKNLFSPLTVGPLELKNRIAMLPMTTGFNEPDETIGDRFIRFFEERARGGAGLISIPFLTIRAGSPFDPGLYDDRFIAGAKRLVEALHPFGAKVFAELAIFYHAQFTDGPPEAVSPSPVWNSVVGCMPRALSAEEIGMIVENHGAAARRAQQAGFDAVELYLGAGNLLGRFLSPLRNLREDLYGGSEENRMRIVLECIESIKRSTTGDYPVCARITVDELIEGGRRFEETEEILKVLEKAGVRMINFHIGAHESRVPTVQPCVPKGAFAHLTARMKEWVKIPVIAANRINDPFVAEKILSEGEADIIGMGRALLADPELPNKSREGRTGEIVPCIACSNCLSAIATGYKDWGTPVNTYCKVNPAVGREFEYALRPPEKRKKVMVIGGGPAGMEAARVAAMRGHAVSLYEKRKEPGGRLVIGCLPPHKEEIRTLYKNLAERARKAGVTIRVGAEAGGCLILQEKPDALVVAVGAEFSRPPVPGADGKNVVFAEDVLAGSSRVSGKVLIIGGGMVGCETGEFLVANSKEVNDITVLEMQERFASDVSTNYRPFLLKRLKEAGVKLVSNAKVEEIAQTGVTVGRADGSTEIYEADAIILASGLKADDSRVAELMSLVSESYAAGDCATPGSIREAIEQGFLAGNAI